MVNLIWKHKEGDSESLLQIPIKLSKSVSSANWLSGQLICNDCESDLEQVYRCVACGKEYKIGEITKRKDKETGIIYDISEKKAFLNMEIDRDIKVEKEIPLFEILKYIELFNGSHYEIYNNDKKVKGYISKIHRWLYTKNVGLLVVFGYREKERSGIIIPTKNKLILSEFRDYELIKDSKQEGVEVIPSDLDDVLKAITKDTIMERYIQFIQAKMEGKTIEVKKEEKKEEVVVECDFLNV